VYAIIKSGGRQLKVGPGSIVEVDRLGFERGEQITIGDVLLVARDGGEITAGAPFVANAKVLAVVEGESRGPKIRIFKKKRRKGMRRSRGHRATFTKLRITEIQV
jgi:large subunit ribosomal protein L21